MFSLILSITEKWGLSTIFGWVASYFRPTPLKDVEKAHDAENKVAALSDDAVANELYKKWTR